jgi:hypothetical protein
MIVDFWFFNLRSLDLNAAESGVQHKPAQGGKSTVTNISENAREGGNCAC